MKTDEELIALLRAEIGKEYGAQARWCHERGVNPNLVSDILLGKRALQPNVAAALGYRKFIRWEKVKNDTPS